MQENIASFGGDADRVTLAGQSAGAISTCALMASPAAVGLFHRSIIHSGGAVGPVGSSARLGDAMQDLDNAERSGTTLAESLGARTADDLRAISSRLLQTAASDRSARVATDPRPPGDFDTSWPIVDGSVLPEPVGDTFRAGRQLDVPILIGNTGCEWATMPGRAQTTDQLDAEVAALFGAQADVFSAAHPYETDEAAQLVSRQMTAERTFYWQVLEMARCHSSTRTAGTWHFRFDHQPPVPVDRHYREGPGDSLGAFHGAELPYLFGTFAARNWRWTDQDRSIADELRSRWIRFAADGSPDGRTGEADWPRFDVSDPRSLVFGAPARVTVTPDLDRIQLWDHAYSRTPAEEPSCG